MRRRGHPWSVDTEPKFLGSRTVFRSHFSSIRSKTHPWYPRYVLFMLQIAEEYNCLTCSLLNSTNVAWECTTKAVESWEQTFWVDEDTRVSWSGTEEESYQEPRDWDCFRLQFRVCSGRKETNGGGSEPFLREAVLRQTEGTSVHCDEVVRCVIRWRHEASGEDNSIDIAVSTMVHCSVRSIQKTWMKSTEL